MCIDPAYLSCHQIRPGGAIAKDGRLKVGDRLLEVSGQSLLGATYQEAVRVLRMAADPMVILVCDGFSPSIIERSLSNQTGRPLQASLWSIDRDDEEAVYINKVRHPQGLVATSVWCEFTASINMV